MLGSALTSIGIKGKFVGLDLPRGVGRGKYYKIRLLGVKGMQRGLKWMNKRGLSLEANVRKAI